MGDRGHTTLSLFNSSVSALLVRIPSAWFFGITMGMGLAGVGLGTPAASVIVLIIGIIYFTSGKWKKNVILYRQNDKAD